MQHEPHETLRKPKVESTEVASRFPSRAELSSTPQADGKLTASQADPQAALRRQYVEALRAAAKQLAKAIAAGVPEWELAAHSSMDFAPFVDLRCGARTRSGHPCKRTDLYRSGRCRMHGGMSTGPRTEAGKVRSSINGKAAKSMKEVA